MRQEEKIAAQIEDEEDGRNGQEKTVAQNNFCSRL